MSPAFAFRYALRNLLRGGQRSLLATACVTFGVMSLVGLQLLAGTIAATVTVEPRALVGGDAALARDGRPLGAADRAELERLKASGALAAYTLVAERRLPLLQREGSGRASFLGQGIGVDPASYPLVGQVELRGAPPAAFGRWLAEPGGVVLTRDVADSLGLAAGDSVRFAAGPRARPVRLHVAGIAEMPPDRRGRSAFYSLATARALAGGEEAATAAQVVWGPEPPAAGALRRAGWKVTTPGEVARERERGANLFGLMLKGAAILGLLLGGLGVANTMQVLLARRRLEIATLKTLGYTRGHLALLFGLEAALLGLSGGLLGTLAGTGLALWLRTLLVRAGALLLAPQLQPQVLAGGVAVGLVTSVIFGLQAIARASAVRPATLLRDLPAPTPWRETVLLSSALGALFSALAALILGSVLYGFGVVAGGFAGLALLLAVLGAAFLAVVHLPVPVPGLVAVARNQLRRQPARALVALAALFCGVFTIGFAGASISSQGKRVAEKRPPADGYNFAVYAPEAESARLRSSLGGAGVARLERRVFASASVERKAGAPLDTLRDVMGGSADRTGSVKVVEGGWPGEGAGALAPARLRGEPWRLALGEEIDLVAPGGARARRAVSGFYEAHFVSPLLPRPEGLLVDEATALTLSGSAPRVAFVGQLPEDRLDRVADAVGRAVPEALVLSQADLNSAFLRELESVYAFIVAVAGLALVAGAVLIANSVGLAMLERRREIGIFKAIGYSSGRILAGIGLEYALLGLLAGCAGMGAVAAAFRAINHFRPAARLALEAAQVPGMIALATGIALASALAVAWRPTHVRPLEVLRQE